MTEPRRTPGAQRWCEEVALVFANAGRAPVTEGTVILGTHVIGPLGADWTTVISTQPLPVPIAPGQATEWSRQVCVDAWRVPPEAHIETRDVRVEWSS